MSESIELVVVGAGQAGIAISHELTSAEVEHLVLERGRVGEAWRRRWDSFCLVIPNWTVQLPGGGYEGPDPNGFMGRDEIVDHMVCYAESFKAPVREGVEVSLLERNADGGFLLQTSSGEIRARQVVLASGGYQRPYRPPDATGFADSLQVIDAEGYRSPSGLPAGKVLVVGSGQTGCQLAEELLEAGRDVFLSCGSAPWTPRRIEGRDVVAWICETPLFDATLADLPSPRTRLGGNMQATGVRGGHDLHYRTLQSRGVNLVGHFAGADGTVARFAPDLAYTVAFADARYNDLARLVHDSCIRKGLKPPQFPAPPPFRADPPEQIDLRDFGVVIFTTGFRPGYASWVDFPEAFADMGSRCRRTAQAQRCPDSTSWASTFSASASPPPFSASRTTRQSWPRG